MTDTGSLKITTPTDREIVMTRTLNAPRQLVFEAMIQPELLKRWLLGPPGWEMTDCELAGEVGGAYRWAWRHADGQTMSLHGVFREWTPPARTVCTQVMEGVPGETLVTSVLAEQGGKTTLTTTVLYASREAATRPSNPVWSTVSLQVTTAWRNSWSCQRRDRVRKPAPDWRQKTRRRVSPWPQR